METTPPAREHEDPAEHEEPDHTGDPRGEDTGQGYPETGPDGASPGEGTRSGPEAGTGGGAEDDAPDTSSPGESDAQQATGNPDAAG